MHEPSLVSAKQQCCVELKTSTCQQASVSQNRAGISRPGKLYWACLIHGSTPVEG